MFTPSLAAYRSTKRSHCMPGTAGIMKGTSSWGWMRSKRRGGASLLDRYANFVWPCATIVAAALAAVLSAQTPTGGTLPPWTRGTLDFHQISTGRGNAALLVFPDGTTLL